MSSSLKRTSVYSETATSSLINKMEKDLAEMAHRLCGIRYCLLFKEVKKEADRATIYQKLEDLEVQLKLAQENLSEQMK